MNLRTSLFEWQKPPVAKLIKSRVAGLFMEPGTGKTRTAIEFVYLRQARIDHVLWFCPVSLKETIHYEVLKHTDLDESQICMVNGQRSLPDVFWYIVGVESIGSSTRVALLTANLITTRSFVVIDESTYIKGHRALRTRRLTTMAAKARYRMILTGTPLTQGVEDLYAQMRFLSPKILGYNSFYSFANNHLEYSEKFKGMILRAHNVGNLAAKVHPYTYQVTKNECMELPAKLYDGRYFSMTEQQRYYYELAKQTAWQLAEEANHDFDSYFIFRLFTWLQQVVSGFWNHEGQTIEIPHSRLDALSGVVDSLPAGEKLIIWCKYHYSIRGIVKMLDADYGTVAQFHGDIGEYDRNRELDRFRADARFLVATQASGGHGLTLTESCYAVFYENEFKYANRLQAEDRQHRIGQARRPTYIDLICRNSIDERIEKAIAKKENLVQDFKRKVDAVKDGSKVDVRKLIQSL